MSTNFVDFGKDSQERVLIYLRLIAYLVIFLFLHSSYAGEVEKKKYAGQIAIEHAELIPSSGDKFSAKAIATIWNGKKKTVLLKSIQSTKGSTELMSHFKFDDNGNSPSPIDLPVFIPPNSEFVMKPKGIFLHVETEQPIIPGQHFPLDIKLSEGGKKLVNAKILQLGSEPTDHHHGDEDS